MQSLNLKFGERRSEWRCCLCCHVRTGTIFYGVWNLLLHVMAMSVLALYMSSTPRQDLGPILPTPLSEVNNIDIEVSGSNVDVSLNSESSITPQSLIPSNFDWWEHRAISSEDMNLVLFVTFSTFAMTLLLIYGAIKGKPSYLMPFFCLQVFDFCIGSISAIGYLCSPPEFSRLVVHARRFPMQEEIEKLSPQAVGLLTAVIFFSVLSVKAYFLGVVWSCYKYLTMRKTTVERAVQFINPDVQNLLPDLPDYETAVKKMPPPSYESATAPVVVDMTRVMNNNNPSAGHALTRTMSLPTTPIQGNLAQTRINGLQQV